MEVLISGLTIGESYFFRDEAQFAALRDTIFPAIVESNRLSKKLRIWSAGCATGAEPYSLAILLTRHFGQQLEGWDIAIHATDLNRNFLDLAASGKFRAWALRATPDELKRSCFSWDGSVWTIDPQYKQWISFDRLNLADGHFVAPWNPCTIDLILCRNVMIYFWEDVNLQLIRRFHHALGPDGWLLVGGTEHNANRFSSFRTVDHQGARFYQKVAPSTALAEPSVNALPSAGLGAPASFLETSPATLSPLPLLTAGGEEPRPTTGSAAAPTDDLRELANRGDWLAASECAQTLLTSNQMNPVFHFYRALISRNLGTPDESEQSLRQAIYLDRNFALAHFHLALALQQRSDKSGAARSFGNVLRILEPLPEESIVMPGPEITVGRLRGLAKLHLGKAGQS
jgi:chemotaxis protein methyltransferase CheR